MALSAGARPKRRSKKVHDPDFLYDFPSGEPYQDDDDLNLDEQSDPVPHNPPSSKLSAKPTKLKSATAHSTPPLPLSAKDSGPSTLSFDQQLQLIQQQKEKVDLELKVLSISRQERPSKNTLADFHTHNTVETVEPRRNKRTIDWPQDFMPSIQSDYDKLELPEFVSGLLLMIKLYDSLVKDAMLAHLELLTIKAISYSWVSVRAFHKFIAKQVEQRRLDWQDLKSTQDQATTFFRHCDLILDHEMRPLVKILSAHLGILNKQSHPLFPRPVEPGIVLVLASVISKIQLLTKSITNAECAKLTILCYIAPNIVPQSLRNDSYSTMPLTLGPLWPGTNTDMNLSTLQLLFDI